MKLSASLIRLGLSLLTVLPAFAQAVVWEKVPGIASDIAIAPDDTVYVIGGGNRSEDREIRRWTGAAWVSLSGKADHVATGLDQSLWVVNRGGESFVWLDGSFRLVHGPAIDLTADRFGNVWMLADVAPAKSWDQAPPDGNLYLDDGFGFEAQGVQGIRLALEPNGGQWLLASDGSVRHRDFGTNGAFGSWLLTSGKGRDIAVGGEGSVWLVGPGGWVGDHSIFVRRKDDWQKVNGTADRIAVSRDGSPWVVTGLGEILKGTVSWVDLTGEYSFTGWNLIVRARRTGAAGTGAVVGYRVDGAQSEIASGVFEFSPGETEVQFTIPLLPKLIQAADNKLVLSLDSASGVLIRQSSSKLEAPIPPKLSLSDTKAGEGGTATFLLKLNREPDRPVVVKYATENASAVAGLDYVGRTNTVVFVPPSKEIVLRIETLKDNFVEGLETFKLRIIESVGAFPDVESVVGYIEDAVPTSDDRPSITYTSSAVVIIFSTSLFAPYVVEAKEKVTDSKWTVLSNRTGDGGPQAYFDYEPKSPTRFYRVRVGF